MLDLAHFVRILRACFGDRALCRGNCAGAIAGHRLRASLFEKIADVFVDLDRLIEPAVRLIEIDAVLHCESRRS